MRAALLCLALLAAPAARADEMRIGHLSIAEDPRYTQDWGYARMIAPPPIITADAAKMGIEDLKFTSDAVGLTVTLDARSVAQADVLATAQQMVADGDGYIILDLPAADVAAIGDAMAGQEALFVNATAPEDSLRAACYANMLHSGPSQRQYMDAFVQYLRSMNWQNALVLVGEDPSDAGLADAFEAAMARMRLKVVARKDFTLAADPEHREGNNVRLLTGGVDYDIVFVADTRGEFGRYVPYATQEPRLVIGSVGLTPGSWHWALERDGASQVSSRFDKATGRKMTSQDWNAWAAMKSLITAYMKTPQPDPVKVREFMTSPKLKLDGSKGVTLNYRPWDGQMRQPITLATTDAVIAIAPIEGFTHQINVLDTLGTDEGEFTCN